MEPADLPMSNSQAGAGASPPHKERNRMDTQFLIHAALGLLVVASIMALLITCPSRANLWASVKHFADDHEAANRLMDERRQIRRALASRASQPAGAAEEVGRA